MHHGMHSLRLLDRTTKFSGVGCNLVAYIRTLMGFASNGFTVVTEAERRVVTYLKC